MSEAKARADARKKKILERGTDRMAIATGQKASTGSNSWRRKKAQTCTPEPDADVKEPLPLIQLDKEHDAEAIEPSKVEELVNDPTEPTTTITTPQTTTASQDPDHLLDDIVDNIDISSLLSKEEIATKEESAKRVVSAAKDYNPVEREKAIAKRKALEQEIVRQTEEFDRLAEVARNKKLSVSKEESNSVGKEDKQNENAVAVQKTAVVKGRGNLSKKEWIKIIRYALLVILGSCVGYWSAHDTSRIRALHPSAMLSSSQTAITSHGMLNDFAHKQSVASEIVTTIFPAIWREESSYLYALLHYPVVIVAVVMLLAKIISSRIMIVDSVVQGDKSQGGILASLLALVMGDFSGITAPLSAFIGESCLYMLVIFLSSACCQGWHPTFPEEGHGHDAFYSTPISSAGTEEEF